MQCEQYLWSMIVAMAAFALSGCTEQPQVYTLGLSTAAADPAPYGAAPFHGNRGVWGQALADRAKGQNDYLRAQ